MKFTSLAELKENGYTGKNGVDTSVIKEWFKKCPSFPLNLDKETFKVTYRGNYVADAKKL